MLAELLASLGIWGALIIFLVRVMDMALDTIRVLFLVRGKKLLVWVLGFFQSLLFVMAITSVLSNLDNPWNVLAYAAGFASGNVVGMLIEDRLAIGHVKLTIMSPTRGAAVTQALRNAGYGVTEMSARGRDGMVSVVYCDVLRKSMDHAENVILEANPAAFITAEDVRPVQHGFWGIGRRA